MFAGVAEEGMLLRWPSLALQARQEEAALDAAAAACQAMPASSAAWEQRITLQARHATLQVCIPAPASCCRVLPDLQLVLLGCAVNCAAHGRICCSCSLRAICVTLRHC